MTLESLNQNPTAPKPHRILVVDDVPENLNLISTMLGQEGYEVRRAPNGNMALQNVPRYRPHLILLDIMMPDMSGYEVCKILKEDVETAHIPIIFLSALNDSFDKVKAFKLGGADYITKPFDLEEVLARVNQQINLQDLQLTLTQQNSRLKAEVKKRKIAENKASKASLAKSQFLARMSHELRTPLSTIIGYADLMLSDSDRSAQDCRSLKAILKSSSHLLTLIEDVLNMTKFESGHIHIHERIVDLQEFLNDLEVMFKLQSDVKDIDFNVNAIAPLPSHIQTDEIKLRQVLINLLSNAFKFTAKGSVTLTVSASEYVENLNLERGYGCLLQFQIEDTGPGILPDEQPLVFEAFEQTTTGRLSQTGSGLGLAISRNFIRLMGGDILLESVPQQGTCFTVAVLVKVPPKTIASEPSDSAPKPFLKLSSPSRILLLLRNQDLRQWVPQFLKQAGYQVRSPEVVNEASWQHCQTWQPSLCLIEWRDDQPYWETLMQNILRQDAEPAPSSGKIRIIAIVPEPEEDNDLVTVPQGCDGMLQPPYSPQDLLRQVQNLERVP
ncbi:MAG: response regulator [Prochlorotrichaceae cyanobacterium]|jgi:signal transduction histidine kinase